jgi:metallo-beta-lactamase class B
MSPNKTLSVQQSMRRARPPIAVILSVCVISLLLSANAPAQLNMERVNPNNPENRQENVNVRQHPFRMIDNIWWVGHSEVGALLITSDEGHFLIDSTAEHDVQWVVENIVTAGFRLDDIKYILNTHTHHEHMSGTPKLQKLLPHAKVVASKESAEVMATGGKTDFRYMMDGNAEHLFEPYQVDLIIGHQEQLTLGDVTLTAHITPGHTEGTTTWTLDVEDGGKTYAAVMFGGLSASGEDRAPLLNNPYYPNIKEDYEFSLKYTADLACDVFLTYRAPTINLHEKLARLEQGDYEINPFVDPEGCQQYMEFYNKRYQTQLQEEQAAAR